jgi:hypothetical protein
MKISKTAAATARRLFGLCQTNGRFDEAKLRNVVTKLIEAKPRDFQAILAAIQRLTRLEMERRQVTVESAVELDLSTPQPFLAVSASGWEMTFSMAPSKVASTASLPHFNLSNFSNFLTEPLS